MTPGYWTVLVDNEVIGANYITFRIHVNQHAYRLYPSPSGPLPQYALLYLIVNIIFSAIYSLLGGTNLEGKLYIFRNCSQGTNYYWNEFKCTTVPKSFDFVFEATVIIELLSFLSYYSGVEWAGNINYNT